MTKEIRENTLVTGTLNVTGNTDLDGTLNVDGTVNIEGATTVDDNLTVTGTIIAPTISDLTNMGHDHLDTNDGGTLTAPAIIANNDANGSFGGSGQYIFPAGIRLVPSGGGHDILNYYDEGTWTPAITSSNADFTTTYTTQTGRYTQVGDVVHYFFNIVLSTISAAGTGDLRVSLPSTPATTSPAVVYFQSLDVPGTPISMFFRGEVSGAFGTLRTIRDNASGEAVSITSLANGDVIAAQGSYFV